VYLIIEIPDTYHQEREYIISLLMHDFLGLKYEIIYMNRKNIRITKGNDSCQKEILLPDILFQTPESLWLTHESLPVLPLHEWNTRDLSLDFPLISFDVPIIYGDHLNFARSMKSISLPIDIFGSSFFMLTRYEEIMQTDRDNLDRFPATSSIAYKAGFLERPIIDEYVEILWACLKIMWPDLKRKMSQFVQKVSCDVDTPSRYAFNGWLHMMKNVVIDVIKHQDIRSLVIGPKVWLVSNEFLDPGDPYNTFQWMMDVFDDHMIKGSFYFIAGWTDKTKKQQYDITMPAIRKLLVNIHERGHEIGLHPSHKTYKNNDLLVSESSRLRSVCAEEGIYQNIWGGRMHWLRWETPTTLYGLEKAGLAYDNTLTYADKAGFRCGTCREFPAFDPVKKRRFNLLIRPLIVMEGTVIGRKYMGLGFSEHAYNCICRLKNACRVVNGTFSILWHNSKLRTKKERRFFQAVLEA